jgi:hypothetical protein
MKLLFILGVSLSLFANGCHKCMQTRPTCSIEPYALIEFINRTNTHKPAYIQRYYDNKPLGDPVTYAVRPRSTYTFRVHPGIYEFGVRMANGRSYAWQTARALWACEVVSIPMQQPPPKQKEKDIRSRRGVQ